MNLHLTQPLKWHGGKHYLAKRIIAEMPLRCKNPNAPVRVDKGWLHYVEPFFGGGSVLLAQDSNGISEVANDVCFELSNFWACLQSPEQFLEFKRRVEAIPFSKVEFDYAESEPQPEDLVSLAINFFIRCRQSMSGRMHSFSPLTRNRTRRGMNEQASAWLNAVEGLAAVHARLKRVVILNDYALNVIKQQDGPRTLFYLDPPYVHETRVTIGEYTHEMTDKEHCDLLALLETIEGRFILSGYHNDIYDENAEAFGWRHVDIEIDNKSSSAKQKKIKTECLWMNY